jgi:hypothetical protein
LRSSAAVDPPLPPLIPALFGLYEPGEPGVVYAGVTLEGLFGGNTVFERSVPVAPVRALLFEFEFVVAGVVIPWPVVPLVEVPLLVPVVDVVGAVVCEPSGVV